MTPTIRPDASARPLRDLVARHVANNNVFELVSVVSKRGTREVVTVSSASEGDEKSIGPKSLVRISSMTKPIVAAATMLLIEHGRFGIDDPVETFIPELANRRVLRSVNAPLDDTEPARRPITVRHLMTCTMGFGFPMTAGPHPVMQEAARLQLGLGPPKPAKPHAPDEWIRRFASLPLMAHPGDAWMYDASFSVLGVLISRAAGKALGVVLYENILGPLGMEDTGFHVPKEKVERLAPCYQPGPAGGSFGLYDGAGDSQWLQPPPFPDAAGGLVSTADNYIEFAQMLLGKGRYRDRRILAEESVDVMTSNQIVAEQRGPASAAFLETRGWGMGMSVALAPEDEWSKSGRYGWEGGLGTSWFNDPNAGVSAILMSQRFPPAFELYVDFWKGVSESWCN